MAKICFGHVEKKLECILFVKGNKTSVGERLYTHRASNLTVTSQNNLLFLVTGKKKILETEKYMSYLPHSCRRISEICILSSTKRIHIVSSEKVKLAQDKYLTGFSLSVYDTAIQKALLLAAMLCPVQTY